MSKLKFCDAGQHYVDRLWRARTRSTPSSCQRCDKGKPKSQENKTQDRQEDEELDKFFKANYHRIPHNCMNCGKALQASTDPLKKCVSAHILPKSKFDSVKLDARNLFFLGVLCGCHHKYDNGDASSRKEMPCYPIAVNALQEFYSDLTPHEQNQAEKYLGL